MVDFFVIFSKFKRLLVTASTSRQDHDTTPPIISTSTSEPDVRDPNMYRNGTPSPPPPGTNTPAHAPDSVYHGVHIASHFTLGHSSSTTSGHCMPTPPRHPYVSTSWDPTPPPWQFQDYDRSRSNISITIDTPPPVYNGGGRPPPYSWGDSSAGPSGERNASMVELVVPPRRPRIGPVVGPSRNASDPSQNQYQRYYLPGRALPLHGRDMHRGTLFARVLPARRNLWLPAIVVGAVVGVYMLVKVGGKDKDVNK